MTIATTADEFHYQCNKCMTVEKPANKDTLVFEDVTGTNLIIYKSILKNAGRDPVNPKVLRKCSCGSKFAKQVRLGNEMKLINTCIACGEQWLDGTRDTDLTFIEGDNTQDINATGSAENVNDDNVNDDNDTTSTSEEESNDVNHTNSDSNSEEDSNDVNHTNTNADKPLLESREDNLHIEVISDPEESDSESEPEVVINPKRKELTLSSPPTNDNAYVWFLIKGDRYVPGIITSIYSVKRFNPKADLVVMVTDDVPESAQNELLKYATHLFHIPYLSFPGKFKMQEKMKDKYSSWIDVSFTKWNMMALPYKKAFLLDADIITRSSLDEIFDKPAPAGVFAEPMSAKNNSVTTAKYSKYGAKIKPEIAKWILNTYDAFGAAASSILLEPNLDDYKLFIKTMEEFTPLSLNNETGSDEQSITYFYSIIKKQTWFSLGARWNTVPWFKKYAAKDPLIIHFMSKEKPWEMKKGEWPDLAEWFDMYEKALASIDS